jgi:DNA polymerase-1
MTNRLILIDGNAIMHRAFHAMPPFTASDGTLVNAVYGFFSMFLKIIEEYKPSHIVVCFDRPKPTFRKQLYVGYQAQREKMDDSLVPQIVLIHRVLEHIGIPIFELDGFEADDLIGTIAYQAGQTPETEVIIVSGDRDMLQLVNPQVKIAMPITGITNMTVFDEEKVVEKYGIHPTQIVDYKALVGDASDNYPGVTGIGPKTAMQLLKEFKTLEGIYENLDVVKQKNANLAQKLIDGSESAALAKKLATILHDAPITLHIEKCGVECFDFNTMKKDFEELGFKSLQKRIPQNSDKRKAISDKKKIDGDQLGLLDF